MLNSICGTACGHPRAYTSFNLLSCELHDSRLGSFPRHSVNPPIESGTKRTKYFSWAGLPECSGYLLRWLIAHRQISMAVNVTSDYPGFVSECLWNGPRSWSCRQICELRVNPHVCGLLSESWGFVEARPDWYLTWLPIFNPNPTLHQVPSVFFNRDIVLAMLG